MFKATLARPDRHPTCQVDKVAINIPTFVSHFDNRAHWSGADNVPRTFSYIGDFDDFAVYQGADCANSQCLADLVYIAPEWRLFVIDIFRLAEQLQVETGPALTKQVNCITFVIIDPPGIHV